MTRWLARVSQLGGPMTPSARRWMRRILVWTRDSWLIVGLALLLFTSLEVAYRAQAAVRNRARLRWSGALAPTSPLAGQKWWKTWPTEQRRVMDRMRFDPYRGWWATPVSLPFLHIDSAGRRLTIPDGAAGAQTRRVMLLGGSVMWGWTARDSFTIAAHLARRLASEGFGAVEVVNLAQPAYNSTQEVITLLLALQTGMVPDIVVDLDGSNDVLAALRERRPGAMIGEQASASRSGLRGSAPIGFRLLGLLRYSALVRRLTQAALPPRATRPAVYSWGSDCGAIAHTYRANILSAEGLGREFGFTPVFLWQSQWATTGKQLTAWERSITAEAGLPELIWSCTRAVDSLMQDRAGHAFVSLTDLFDGDTTSVFLDEFGHLTEAGNKVVAQRIADLVIPLLRAIPAKGGAASANPSDIVPSSDRPTLPLKPTDPDARRPRQRLLAAEASLGAQIRWRARE